MRWGPQAVPRLARQFHRLERSDLRRWLERTNILVHVSILVVVPVLMALVTVLSNAVGALSFLVYPPLASGAYTLFANPEGRYASPLRFVGGLTAGAACGWVAVEFGSRFLYTAPPGQIHAAAAALTVFLTGITTWILGIEEPSAFAMALVTLFVHGRVDDPGLFVLSAAVSSAIVATGFAGWRRYIYEQRAQYLYESTSGDDHVLVPMRGPNPDETALLAARLADAHQAGKVVLLDMCDEAWIARAERSLLEEHDTTRLVKTGPSYKGGRIGADPAGHREELGSDEVVSEAVSTLERKASDIERKVGVPCQVVVATPGPSPAATVLQTARQANCDLVATSYESNDGRVTQYVRDLFRGDRDVLVHRSHEGGTDWRRVLVPVRRAGGVAHNMIDFATRLAGEQGEVSVGTCVATERERRRAEDMLADLVEPFEGTIETRISRSSIEAFLDRHSHEYDLVIVGASQDRSAASRILSPPTFERIDEAADADIAIVDRH